MAIELLFYGGMRVGELLAITGKDINFEQGIINIDKTINTDSDRVLTYRPQRQRTA